MKSLKIKISKIILLFTSVIIVFSCSKKDEDPVPASKVYPEENFWQGFINNAGFNAPTNISANKTSLCVFIPKVKGKINSYVIKIPVAGNVEVRLFDYTTSGSYLINETITVPNTEYVKIVTPIELIKDHKYLLSMNCQNYYSYTRTSTLVPVNSGNISITHFGLYSGRLFTLSDYGGNLDALNIDNTIGGNISFNFQQTE